MFVLFEVPCLLGDDFTHFHGMTYSKKRDQRELGCWKPRSDGLFQVRFGDRPAIVLPRGADKTLIIEFPNDVPTRTSTT